jgi:hypothetical protein
MCSVIPGRARSREPEIDNHGSRGLVAGNLSTPSAVMDSGFDSARRSEKEAAGFGFVPEPVPMRNANNVVVYYLFFACPKPVAERIIEAIFSKYR